MSNQTLRKSPGARSGQSKTGAKGRGPSSSRYRRQTARAGVEFRRDGKPLIFGWGRHLSRLQKNRIQVRATYSFFGIIVIAVVGIFAFGWLQQNVLIPNQTMVSVNSANISQDAFRKELAYQAQVLWNKLQSEILQQQAASAKANAGDQSANQRNQTLIALIQTDEASYQQATITQSTSDQLVQDQLIQQGIQQFEASGVPASHFTVTTKDVNARLDAFKKAFPKGETYQQFLSANSLSDDDVRASIRIDLRHDHMQTYLSSLLVSPTLQLHLRKIELDTLAHANSVRAQLLKDPSNATWSTLAKQSSLDPNTKTVGGDMGWVFRGNSDAAIENWAFGTTAKVNQISPVIKDTSGTFNIVEILGKDAKRAVDPSQLSAAKTNALDHWLSGQKADPRNHVGTPNQNMLSASRNMPVKPNLNASLPSYSGGVPNPGGASGQ
jgi:PPIC-type PPIASE domain